MKLNKTITTLVASMFLCFAFAACEKENTNPGGDNGGGNNNGPVITDDDTGIELNMSNNGDDVIYFTSDYVSPEGYVYTASCFIKMSSSNNFVLNYKNGDYGDIDYDIASVGQVTGLSSVNNIPTSGWVKQIAVNPGTGYIIRYKGKGFGYTYARLYVKDWIVITGGGIIGATVVYQDKWGQEPNGEGFIGSKWEKTMTGVEDGVAWEDTWILEFNSAAQGLLRMQLIYGAEISEESFVFSYNYNFNSKQGEMWIDLDGNSFHWYFYVSGDQLTVVFDNETTDVYTRI